MTTPSTSQTSGDEDGHEHEHGMEEYGGGTIKARHGYLPIWLLVVYAVLFIWSLYYMVVYWGGLGPGRL